MKFRSLCLFSVGLISVCLPILVLSADPLCQFDKEDRDCTGGNGPYCVTCIASGADPGCDDRTESDWRGSDIYSLRSTAQGLGHFKINGEPALTICYSESSCTKHLNYESKCGLVIGAGLHGCVNPSELANCYDCVKTGVGEIHRYYVTPVSEEGCGP